MGNLINPPRRTTVAILSETSKWKVETLRSIASFGMRHSRLLGWTPKQPERRATCHLRVLRRESTMFRLCRNCGEKENRTSESHISHCTLWPLATTFCHSVLSSEAYIYTRTSVRT